MHVRSQNAGLIVRRSLDRCVFESFEVSPTTDAVITTKGRLQRCFPGPAVAVNHDRIARTDFWRSLAELLTKLDAEASEDVQPVVVKAGSHIAETRDTAHPKFVTEMLTSMLRAIGQPSDVHRIYKHTRDDVLWKDAFKPWRRSPLWLFLRVVLQTSLARTTSGAELHVRYKSFMLFFMAHVLDHGLQASLPGHVLFTMTAKISRRALKLGIVDATTWSRYVRSKVEAAQHQLICRWNQIEKHLHFPEPHLALLTSQRSLQSDSSLTLLKLRPYLAEVSRRTASPVMRNPFASSCRRRLPQCISAPLDKSFSANIDEGERRLYLADLELWVEDFLSDWMDANFGRKSACATLAEVIAIYTSAASSLYADIPDDRSLMILTTMDLWVALDRCAINCYPLLREYSPGFSSTVFEPLLLPKRPQMERLLHVEQYLAGRRAAASTDFTSIFQSVGTSESLAVRYFERSPHHQEMRRKIEEQATIDRSQKIVEFVGKRRRYDELMRQADRTACQYVRGWRRHQQFNQHSGSCHRCQLKADAKALVIEFHEWPVPRKDMDAKATVFELDVPTTISQWRDTTYSILVDVLSVRTRAVKQQRGKLYHLLDYSGLRGFVGPQSRRLQLVSAAKPFTVTHYKPKKIPQASEENICVNHGSVYAMYDTTEEQWTEELLGRWDVRQQCTFKLPPGPYKGLQDAVSNTSHTSNEIIARQVECPETLTIHEFYAFGTLRSGHRLQWRSIARELCATALDFGRQETHDLVAQAAWQACPLGGASVCREAHADLEEKDFGSSLLSALDRAITTVEYNWQGAPAARLFVTLAARLLSVSVCGNVHAGCFAFLRRARDISLRWTRELNQKLVEGQEEQLYDMKTLEMALTCHGTFDVDRHLFSGLLHSDDDVAALTECSIVVRDRCPAQTSDLPASTKTLLQRHWRLSHRLEPYLRQRILEHPSGLDLTVHRLWAGYTPSIPWAALAPPSERWLTTETTDGDCGSSMRVQYNILDGTLLVNGSPLARLPSEYESHPTFCRLFGKVT